jgi:hypothetical protein
MMSNKMSYGNIESLSLSPRNLAKHKLLTRDIDLINKNILTVRSY